MVTKEAKYKTYSVPLSALITPGLPSSFCREDSGNESLPHSGLSLISKHTSSLCPWTVVNAGPAMFDKESLMKGPNIDKGSCID